MKLSSQELSDREVKEQASYVAHIAKSWNVELSLGRFFIVSQDVWIVVLICVVVVSRYGFLDDAVDILSFFTTTCGVCTPTCDGTTSDQRVQHRIKESNIGV